VYDPYYSEPYGVYPHSYHHPSYYDYYYYPTIGVYFQYSTGYYYYRSKDKWIHSRQLPPRYRLDPRDRVIVRIPYDKPYKRYDENRHEFKPNPKYRRDKEIDRRERDYNRRWHEDYLKRRDKSKRAPSNDRQPHR
jgi:hypothetical protein